MSICKPLISSRSWQNNISWKTNYQCQYLNHACLLERILKECSSLSLRRRQPLNCTIIGLKRGTVAPQPHYITSDGLDSTTRHGSRWVEGPKEVTRWVNWMDPQLQQNLLVHEDIDAYRTPSNRDSKSPHPWNLAFVISSVRSGSSEHFSRSNSVSFQ